MHSQTFAYILETYSVILYRLFLTGKIMKISSSKNRSPTRILTLRNNSKLPAGLRVTNLPVVYSTNLHTSPRLSFSHAANPPAARRIRPPSCASEKRVSETRPCISNTEPTRESRFRMKLWREVKRSAHSVSMKTTEVREEEIALAGVQSKRIKICHREAKRTSESVSSGDSFGGVVLTLERFCSIIDINLHYYRIVFFIYFFLSISVLNRYIYKTQSFLVRACVHVYNTAKRHFFLTLCCMNYSIYIKKKKKFFMDFYCLFFFLFFKIGIWPYGNNMQWWKVSYSQK